MRKPTAEMTDAELRVTVENFARMFAYRDFLKTCPRCSREQAARHADRHWQEWRDTAIDFLAASEADRVTREAAPSN